MANVNVFANADFTSTATAAMVEGTVSVRASSTLTTTGGNLAMTVGNRCDVTASSSFTSTGGDMAVSILSQVLAPTSFRTTTSLLMGFQREAIARSVFSTTGRASISYDGEGLTVQELVQRVLSLLGLCCENPASACYLDDIIAQINAAMQVIWSQAHNLDSQYFARKSHEITVTAASSSTDLPQGVQNVLGPVRESVTKRTMVNVTSRAMFDNYVAMTYGGATPSGPRAYFVEPLNQALPDNVRLSFNVTPTPTVDTVFLVDTAMEPPRYSRADIPAGTPLQIPHRYAELLLLPIVKQWATGLRQFLREDLKQEIARQHQAAMQALGLVEPATTSEKLSRGQPSTVNSQR